MERLPEFSKPVCADRQRSVKRGLDPHRFAERLPVTHTAMTFPENISQDYRHGTIQEEYMRKIIFAVVVAVAVVPAAFADTGTSPNPSQQCVTLRTSMGTTNFNQTYGTNTNKSNAFGKCVSKIAAANSQATTNAASSCRTERSADPNAFKAKYGTNANKSNAFGKCVSQKTHS